MMTLLKMLTSEAVCNTTPNSYSSPCVRLVNKGAAVSTVILKENPRAIALTINASANGTTLITLGSGTTSTLKAGNILVNSSNVQVINTDANSVITAIVNTTAFTTNVDIIIANGVSTVYAVDSIKTLSILPNSELLIDKKSIDWIESNNAANVLCIGVSYRG
jgi:hypothetical protein